MMLPTLREAGWDPVVLAVESRFVEAPVEQDLLETFPADIQVVRCAALDQRLTRRFGFGSLSLRSSRFIRRAGDRILRDGNFDLVFFSTTEFGVLPLGPRWKDRFGVPFVVDLQDPWVNTYYRQNRKVPPGGPIKHGITQLFARLAEGRTLREAAHVVVVSGKYSEELRSRHEELAAVPFSIIPFAGSRSDFSSMQSLGTRQTVFEPGDGRRHWIYAGTAPPGIRPAATAFFLAMRRAIETGILRKDEVRLHFVGTDYAPAELASRRIQPIAEELSMGSVVEEHPARIPYLETLRCLTDADALLVFGWDDPGYTASKIYPYVLASKPLLTVLHDASSASEIVRRVGAGTHVQFRSRPDVERLSSSIFESWFVTRAFERSATTNWNLFEQYTAGSMTRAVADVFDSSVNDGT